MSEAIKFLNNAKELLKKSRIEGDRYDDVKYVQEACGTAYLAVLKAIDEYLTSRGVTKKELPKSVEGYREKLRKYLSHRDGKLVKQFEQLYDELHIAGHYRGLISNVNALKEIFKSAKGFIDKMK